MKKCDLCYGENEDGARFCRWCSRSFSSSREAHGSNRPQATSVISAVVIVGAIAFFGTIGMKRSCGGSDTAPTPTAASGPSASRTFPAQHAEGQVISGEHRFVCRSRLLR